ncbi:MAG: cyclic nucleotide-binding domain-containing protein [Devosia sp.]
MSSLATLAASQPIRTLAPGEVLIVEGEAGGNLYVLESGRLTVERGGVTLATISQPDALVGEMSVLLGTRNSATVRAADETRVRTIFNAEKHLIQDPELSFHVAALLAARLEATSALLVELTKQNPGKSERGLLASIFSALTAPVDTSKYVTRRDLFEP